MKKPGGYFVVVFPSKAMASQFKDYKPKSLARIQKRYAAGECLYLNGIDK